MYMFSAVVYLTRVIGWRASVFLYPCAISLRILHIAQSAYDQSATVSLKYVLYTSANMFMHRRSKFTVTDKFAQPLTLAPRRRMPNDGSFEKITDIPINVVNQLLYT